MDDDASVGDGRPRCSWGDHPEADYRAYHDREWGVPVHDDRLLFEFLTLEGAQAGLSWSTILKKRSSYRRSFANFDPAMVARFSPAKIDRLLQDPGPRLGGVTQLARSFRCKGSSGRSTRTSGGSSAAARSRTGGGRFVRCLPPAPSQIR